MRTRHIIGSQPILLTVLVLHEERVKRLVFAESISSKEKVFLQNIHVSIFIMGGL